MRLLRRAPDQRIASAGAALRVRPGRMTTSNSRPLARCRVMIRTRVDESASASARNAPNSSMNRCPIGNVRAYLVLGQQRKESIGRLEIDRIAHTCGAAER